MAPFDVIIQPRNDESGTVQSAPSDNKETATIQSKNTTPVQIIQPQTPELFDNIPNADQQITTPVILGGDSWIQEDTDFDAQVNAKYMVNSENVSVSVVLPPATIGEFVSIFDYKSASSLNNIVITTDEHFEGDIEANQYLLDLDNAHVSFVYSGSALGWTIVD